MHVEVSESAVIKAPAEKVWALIGDFNAMPDWQPDIVASRIDNGASGKAVGCVRTTTRQDGSEITGIQLDRSDTGFWYRYAILKAPVPIRNYVGTLRCMPVTSDGTSFVHWNGTFEADAAVAAEAKRILSESFLASFRNIARILER